MEKSSFVPFETLEEINDKLQRIGITSDEAIGLLHAVKEYFVRSRHVVEIERALSLLMHWADRSPGESWEANNSQENYWNNQVADKALFVLSRLISKNMERYLHEAEHPGKTVLKLLRFFSFFENIPQQDPSKKQIREFVEIIYRCIIPDPIPIHIEGVTLSGIQTLRGTSELSLIRQHVFVPLFLSEGGIELFIYNKDFDAIPQLTSHIKLRYLQKYGKEPSSVIAALVNEKGSTDNELEPLVLCCLTLQEIKNKQII